MNSDKKTEIHLQIYSLKNCSTMSTNSLQYTFRKGIKEFQDYFSLNLKRLISKIKMTNLFLQSSHINPKKQIFTQNIYPIYTISI